MLNGIGGGLRRRRGEKKKERKKEEEKKRGESAGKGLGYQDGHVYVGSFCPGQ